MGEEPEDHYTCSNCKAILSVFWNKKEDGWLCNSCYLFSLRNGMKRPVEENTQCWNCKTTSSLLRWKKGPDNQELCESCGRYWEKFHAFLKLQCIQCNTTLSRCWRRDSKGNYICESCRLKNPSIVLKASKRRRRKASGDPNKTELSPPSSASEPRRRKSHVNTRETVQPDKPDVGDIADMDPDSDLNFADEKNDIIRAAESLMSFPKSTILSSPTKRTSTSPDRMTERQQISFLLQKDEPPSAPTLPLPPPSSLLSLPLPLPVPSSPLSFPADPVQSIPLTCLSNSASKDKRGKKKKRKTEEPETASSSLHPSEWEDRMFKLKNEIIKLENNEKELKKELNDMKRREQGFSDLKNLHQGEIERLRFENLHWKTEVNRLNFELQKKDDELEKIKKGGKAQTFTPKLLFKSEAVNM